MVTSSVRYEGESGPYSLRLLETSIGLAVGDTLNFSDHKADVIAYQDGVYYIREWSWHKYVGNPVLQAIVRAQCWAFPGKFRWWLR
jgi:hypothetical protein